MHEVADDRQLDVAFLGLVFDALDLVVGAVDEREPGAAVFGVAPLRFVEDAGDHGGGGFDDAGGQPLVGRDRSRCGLVACRPVVGEDVGRRARRGRGVVHGADLRHPLVADLLGGR